MVKLEHLVKEFGARRAVDDISFQVEKGTVLGFLGPNGAGKTTTIRMVAGYLIPTSGRALVEGCDVALDPVRAQKQIGYMPENAPLYEEMTVEGFLRFVAELRGFTGAALAERVSAVMASCFLRPVRSQIIDTLSKGYRQRTSFAQALLHDPPVLLLDEPTEGLDPNQKQVVREMIRGMGKEKIIILSTHVLEEVEAICSRVIIISKGRIVADSTPDQLKKRSRYRNILTVELRAGRDEAVAAFRAVGDVEGVEVLDSEEGRPRLRLLPRRQQPLAVSALEVARSHNWPVLGLETDSGHLDDVFRELTITEDVG